MSGHLSCAGTYKNSWSHRAGHYRYEQYALRLLANRIAEYCCTGAPYVMNLGTGRSTRTLCGNVLTGRENHPGSDYSADLRTPVGVYPRTRALAGDSSPRRPVGRCDGICKFRRCGPCELQLPASLWTRKQLIGLYRKRTILQERSTRFRLKVLGLRVLTRDIDITADRAYVVVPATYSYKEKGPPVTEPGSIWTLALKKGEAGWRITGWAWTAP